MNHRVFAPLLCWTIAAAAFSPSVLWAQAISAIAAPAGVQQPAPGPEVRSVTLSPAVEPSPALKYRLGQDPTKLVPGNAAPMYYRAILLLPKPNDQEEDITVKLERWRTLSVDMLPEQEIADALGPYQNSLSQVEMAVARRDCDWNLGIEVLTGAEAISFLLPEINEMRRLARLLECRFLLEISQGRIDDALHTLSVGYRMAKDAAAEPILVNGLVGVAIANTMDANLLKFMQLEGAPNLYWAISSLERPIVDLRPAIQWELNFAERMFPFLADAETSQRSSEAWMDTLVQGFRDLIAINGSQIDIKESTLENLASRLGVAAMVVAAYPTAKEQLIASGYDEAKVNAMPSAQVVAIQTMRASRQIYQENAKWMNLPYWQARRGLKKAQELFDRPVFSNTGELAPWLGTLHQLLMPAVDKAYQATIRNDQQLAALQTIEAIRMYAAGNDGRLPPSLDVLNDIAPAVDDPTTGGPLNYRVEGGKAILETTPITPGASNWTGGLRYEITIR